MNIQLRRQVFRTSQLHRAGVAATAILQIVKTVPAADLQEPIEAYLRDEFAELERQVAAERSSPDV
jgi:hypothetical protein